MKKRVRAALTQVLLRTPKPCYGDRWPDHVIVAIGWNTYRCTNCATRRQPERLYHRIVYRLSRGRFDPLGFNSYHHRPF